jgi:hypothetical protein
MKNGKRFLQTFTNYGTHSKNQDRIIFSKSGWFVKRMDELSKQGFRVM